MSSICASCKAFLKIFLVPDLGILLLVAHIHTGLVTHIDCTRQRYVVFGTRLAGQS